MTYVELSKIKTAGFITNHVIDDVVSNARWGYTKAAFKKALVTDQEIDKIIDAAKAEGVELSVSLDIAFEKLLAMRPEPLPKSGTVVQHKVGCPRYEILGQLLQSGDVVLRQLGERKGQLLQYSAATFRKNFPIIAREADAE